MARAKKEEKQKEPKLSDSRSVLRLAFEAFQRGDAVQTRELAKAVVEGKRARDEEKVAKELATMLSIEGAVVADDPGSVAKELISRTVVPPKTYVFAAAVGATFLLLVVLAAVRY